MRPASRADSANPFGAFNPSQGRIDRPPDSDGCDAICVTLRIRLPSHCQPTATGPHSLETVRCRGRPLIDQGESPPTLARGLLFNPFDDSGALLRSGLPFPRPGWLPLPLHVLCEEPARAHCLSGQPEPIHTAQLGGVDSPMTYNAGLWGLGNSYARRQGPMRSCRNRSA
jgi:hypothetical protein